MILLIPLVIVIGLYFGVHELQEHIHAEAGHQHNEQSIQPSIGDTDGQDSAELSSSSSSDAKSGPQNNQ